MERVGFVSCTAASHQGAIKEAVDVWGTPGASTLMQCMFHSYSKPEGALVQKVQNGLV